MAMIRLDKFFSSQEIFTRKEIRPLIKQGAVFVNGEAALSPEQKLDPEKDTVTLFGKPVFYQPYRYLMLNKPAGVVSATDDKTHQTVLDLVPPELYRKGLFPAGRLDMDTVGFVLLTDDGNFAHEILSPQKHVPKTYLVRLDGPVLPGAAETLRSGTVLQDGSVCRPAEITVLEDTDKSLVKIVLREGKYHQIKRMFGTIGLGVDWLKRTKIGGLELDPTLPEGKCREILYKELEKILVK